MVTPNIDGSAADAHEHGGHHGAAPTMLGGLAVATGEYRLDVDEPTFVPGQPARFCFAVVGSHGPERDFDEHGGVQMHLIVVRRDLTAYQHLHPTLDPDGRWRTELVLPTAGVYRAYVDFERSGEQTVLGADLFAGGEFVPEPLPVAAAHVSVGGYRIQLEAQAEAATTATLVYRLTRDSRLVEAEPYLGAGGHLVALRQGDLAYLHVHPLSEEPGELRFVATFPTAGNYRLFLQFKHEGDVHTAAFTLPVAEGRR